MGIGLELALHRYVDVKFPRGITKPLNKLIYRLYHSRTDLCQHPASGRISPKQ